MERIYWRIARKAAVGILSLAMLLCAVVRISLAESEADAEFSTEEPAAEETAAAEGAPAAEEAPAPAPAVAQEIILNNYRIDEILKTMPADLDTSRIMVVLRAYGLVDAVSYYWGGKSDVIGWDTNWGQLNVLDENGAAMNPDEPFGLDCSGFVRWCFINASCSRSFGGKIGRSTEKQWENTLEITMDELQPGDLVFRKEPDDTVNHVGVYAGVDKHGDQLVIHCGCDGVKLDKLENTILSVPRRPILFTGDDLAEFHDRMERREDRAAMRDFRYITELRAAAED